MQSFSSIDAKAVNENQTHSSVESTENTMKMIEQEDFVVTSSLSFHENKATAEEKFVKLQKSPTGNHHGNVKLSRSVTLLKGISLMVGVMIGSGIFVSPRYVLLHSGSVGVTLMVWISSGVMAMFGALCYCELGTMIQRSGGELTYIREALGPLAGFLVSWTMVLILKPAYVAIITLSFASYAIQSFLNEKDMDTEQLIKFIAAVCIILITTVNCVSSRWAGQMRVIFMVLKLLAIGIIVLIGASQIVTRHYENF